MNRSGVDLPRSAQPVALGLRANGVLVEGGGTFPIVISAADVASTSQFSPDEEG